MLADHLLRPSEEVPPHLSEVEQDGDGLSAWLTAVMGGETRMYAVRAAPLVARGEVIGAVEARVTPPPGSAAGLARGVGAPAPDGAPRHQERARRSCRLHRACPGSRPIRRPARYSTGPSPLPARSAGSSSSPASRGAGRAARGGQGPRGPGPRRGRRGHLTGIEPQAALPRQTVMADPVVFSVLWAPLRAPLPVLGGHHAPTGDDPGHGRRHGPALPRVRGRRRLRRSHAPSRPGLLARARPRTSPAPGAALARGYRARGRVKAPPARAADSGRSPSGLKRGLQAFSGPALKTFW